jgi:hypothetical protein
MKLCCGDERARWGPAACPGWARASERERASLTGGRCNPAILPDTAHQNVLTTPPAPQPGSRRHVTLVNSGDGGVLVTAGKGGRPTTFVGGYANDDILGARRGITRRLPAHRHSGNLRRPALISKINPRLIGRRLLVWALAPTTTRGWVSPKFPKPMDLRVCAAGRALDHGITCLRSHKLKVFHLVSAHVGSPLGETTG